LDNSITGDEVKGSVVEGQRFPEVDNLNQIGDLRMEAFGQAYILFHRIDAISLISPSVK